jgi:hypothetical protein
MRDLALLVYPGATPLAGGTGVGLAADPPVPGSRWIVSNLGNPGWPHATAKPLREPDSLLVPAA